MKTEQEQIEKMSNIITDCLCKKCDDCKHYNGHFCTEKDTGKTEALIQAGYGDVSEYKAEIERLKAEVKQAKIDVLNKAKEKLDSAPNGWAYTGYIDDLIEEVEEQWQKTRLRKR